MVVSCRIYSQKYHLLNIFHYIYTTLFSGNELWQVVGAKMRPMWYAPLAACYIGCQRLVPFELCMPLFVWWGLNFLATFFSLRRDTTCLRYCLLWGHFSFSCAARKVNTNANLRCETEHLTSVLLLELYMFFLIITSKWHIMDHLMIQCCYTVSVPTWEKNFWFGLFW